MDKSKGRDLYAIFFEGKVLPGRDPDTVKQRLAVLYKCDPASIGKRLFSGKRVTIKSGITLEQAEKVKVLLNRAGADCSIVRWSPPAASPMERPTRKPLQQKKGRKVFLVATSACIIIGIAVAVVLWLPHYKGIFSSKKGAHRNTSSAAVRKYARGIAIADDLAMASVSVPISKWQQSQQKLYWQILRKQNYDVLVAPFQIQYYGIDRAGRSLMTRYLAAEIERTTGLTVADPTLVARALGERSRRFDFRMLDNLAADLKVRYLIMGFVGHDRDDKMKLKVIVKKYEGGEDRTATDIDSMFKDIAAEPPSNDMYSSLFKNARTVIDEEDNVFSDEHPPSEIFRERLKEFVSMLPFEVSEAKEEYYERVENINVPDGIAALVSSNSSSPIINAYYLQLMGVLYPDKTVAMEHLFERSLAALQQVSPASPDYRLLRARALFYLYRRPVAIKALGSPETPAEKAFQAYLNGNLAELREWTEKIKSPVHKLMSLVELNQLNYTYSRVMISEADAKEMASDYPGWELPMIQRLYRDSIWFAPSNIAVKADLDKTLPVKGKTAEDIIRSSMLFKSRSEIDFSVYNHISELLKNSGEKYYLSIDSIRPRSGDYIDFLGAMGEANLLHAARLRIVAQSLYEVGKEILDGYEEVYEGHPMMAYMKAVVMGPLSKQATDEEKAKLEAQRRAILQNAVYWFNGQIEFPANAYQELVPVYKDDFPHRASSYTVEGAYHVAIEDEAIADAVAKLSGKLRYNAVINYHDNKYTNWDFDSVKMMLEIFGGAGLDRAAEVVMAENSNRFAGNPEKYNLQVTERLVAGDLQGAKKISMDFMAAAPTDWLPYYQLGRFLSMEGNYDEALKVYRSCPLFNEYNPRISVGLSGMAYSAGQTLSWYGGIRESVKMYELAESYGTGSEMEMRSSAHLAIIKGDYSEALAHYGRIVDRYKTTEALGNAISMLHLIGRSRTAEKIFNSQAAMEDSFQLIGAIMVGRRMQQQSLEETFNRLLQRPDFKSSYVLPLYLVLDGCTDRKPTTELLRIIDRDDYSPVNFYGSNISDMKKNTGAFVRAYIAFREGSYDKAYNDWAGMDVSSMHSTIKANSYFYASISAIRAGKSEELPNLKKKFGILAKRWTEFQGSMINETSLGVAKQYMVDAYILGRANRHAEAIEKLRMGRGLSLRKDIMMFNIYQVVEVAEWLYAETGHDEYRKMAVRWARDYQRLNPEYAWTYSVEANLAEFPQDRLRALAIALYIDRDSERISHFSRQEKEEALKWLKYNNPFLRG